MGRKFLLLVPPLVWELRLPKLRFHKVLLWVCLLDGDRLEDLVTEMGLFAVPGDATLPDDNRGSWAGC